MTVTMERHSQLVLAVELTLVAGDLAAVSAEERGSEIRQTPKEVPGARALEAPSRQRARLRVARGEWLPSPRQPGLCAS